MKTLIIGAVVAVIAIGGYFYPQEDMLLGGTTNYDELKLDTAPVCFEFYATSTATLNRMVASSTATIEGVDGVLMLGYGACP